MKSSTEKNETEFIAKRICPKYGTNYCYDDCNWFGNCPDQMAAEQLPEGKVFCSSCGKVIDRWVAFEVFTGRTQHLCPKCYLKGQSDAGQNVQRRYHTLQKRRRER